MSSLCAVEFQITSGCLTQGRHERLQSVDRTVTVASKHVCSIVLGARAAQSARDRRPWRKFKQPELNAVCCAAR